MVPVHRASKRHRMDRVPPNKSVTDQRASSSQVEVRSPPWPPSAPGSSRSPTRIGPTVPKMIAPNTATQLLGTSCESSTECASSWSPSVSLVVVLTGDTVGRTSLADDNGIGRTSACGWRRFRPTPTVLSKKICRLLNLSTWIKYGAVERSSILVILFD